MADNFPLPVFFFRVDIGGREIGFQEVQGLGADIEYEELRDVANASSTNRTFKKIKYKNLILKKGVFKDGLNDIKDVAAIFYQAGGGRNPRVTPTTIIIDLLNEGEQEVLTWTLRGCVPVKYEFGALNAMQSDILIETMEFQYQEMKVEIR